MVQKPEEDQIQQQQQQQNNNNFAWPYMYTVL